MKHINDEMQVVSCQTHLVRHWCQQGRPELAFLGRDNSYEQKGMEPDSCLSFSRSFERLPIKNSRKIVLMIRARVVNNWVVQTFDGMPVIFILLI